MLRERTKRLWTSKYPGVPFDIDDSNVDVSTHIFDVSTNQLCNEEHSTKIVYDIKSAALRQGSFFYQVTEGYFLTCCVKIDSGIQNF